MVKHRPKPKAPSPRQGISSPTRLGTSIEQLAGIRNVDHKAILNLVDDIFADRRTVPLVLITPSRGSGDRPLLDPQVIHQHLGAAADIVVLTNQRASWALSDALPDALNTYGGAVRVFQPGATENDNAAQHPIVFVDPADPHHAITLVANRVHGIAYTSSTPTPSDALPKPAGPDNNSQAANLRTEADQLTASNQRLHNQLADAKKTVLSLRQETRQLTERVKELKATAWHTAVPPLVYSDPQKQFRYEIEQTWLWTQTEAERAEWALRPYAMGADWIPSITEITGNTNLDHRHILGVAIDIITGRAGVIPARRVRPHHEGPLSQTPQLVRADGATAWRCNMKSNSPAAPRLTWWKLPDGTIELGRITLHDDNRLR